MADGVLSVRSRRAVLNAHPPASHKGFWLSAHARNAESSDGEVEDWIGVRWGASPQQWVSGTRPVETERQNRRRRKRYRREFPWMVGISRSWHYSLKSLSSHNHHSVPEGWWNESPEPPSGVFVVYARQSCGGFSQRTAAPLFPPEYASPDSEFFSFWRRTIHNES